MSDAELIRSLEAAVLAAPADPTLRLHLAELMVRAGRGTDAVGHLAVVLQQQPDSTRARSLMTQALAPPGPAASAPGPAPEPGPQDDAPSPGDERRFDWSRAERDVGDAVPPMFVHAEDAEDAAQTEDARTEDAQAEDGGDGLGAAYEIERSTLRLSDVGGMNEVKKRLEAAFLAPMRNPELSRLYGKSLRGGLMLYGPPGCGKTFLARALAGELGARFLTVSVSDVLDKFLGESEQNVHRLFQFARQHAPTVLFLDEVDAIGQKRSNLHSSAMRSTVNQLLLELDGAQEQNDGVFVLAATNHPWDVDAALRRPGRLDRTLLVLPPDREAREAIFRHHLSDRPVERVDVRALAKRTDGLSGADIAHVCETAAERALLDSVASGEVRMIGMPDLLAAVGEVKPSLATWFETARNVAMFANEGGVYDDLLTYLRKRHML